jgi:DNA replication protein DnaC
MMACPVNPPHGACRARQAPPGHACLMAFSSRGATRRGPMILTSNQSFGAWGEVFGDRIIATAILDRETGVEW